MQRINGLYQTVTVSLLFFCLCACASRSTNLDRVDTTNLSQLESVQVNPRAPSISANGLSPLRTKSLEDSAMSIGAQGGLAWASNEINTRMNKDRKYLDSIFNFNTLMLNHGVLPPVLEEGDFSLNL